MYLLFTLHDLEVSVASREDIWSFGIRLLHLLVLLFLWQCRAATIHKSQGCTLTCAELMLENTFDYGQVYVALSRVKSVQGLWLSKPIRPQSIRANPAVLDFYGVVSQNSAQATTPVDTAVTPSTPVPVLVEAPVPPAQIPSAVLLPAAIAAEDLPAKLVDVVSARVLPAAAATEVMPAKLEDVAPTVSSGYVYKKAVRRPAAVSSKPAKVAVPPAVAATPPKSTLAPAAPVPVQTTGNSFSKPEAAVLTESSSNSGYVYKKRASWSPAAAPSAGASPARAALASASTFTAYRKSFSTTSTTAVAPAQHQQLHQQLHQETPPVEQAERSVMSRSGKVYVFAKDRA